MSKEEVLEIYRKEAEKRGQDVKKHISQNGIEYYTSGELNIHKLVTTALTLIG